MELQGIGHLVVGAGITGATLARRIAENLGEQVLVVDKHEHIGGHCHSAPDPETGIECHVFGSHIFHTASERVWKFVTRFTEFNGYRHKVLTTSKGEVYYMPVNLLTINKFFNLRLKPHEVPAFLDQLLARESDAEPQNLEEKAISLVGRELYEAFIKGYTEKQWETDPRELPADIITRLPFRHSYECDYFTDRWQGIPLNGYDAMFKAMLDHENIDVRLNTDFFAFRDSVPEDCTVWFTGPIDSYFNFSLGELDWRSLRFEREVLGVGDAQGTAVMNYADTDVPFTRIHEYRHYHPERTYYSEAKTVITREFPCAWKQGDEAYYPVNTARNMDLLEAYRREAAALGNVIFCGRLGQYKYYDMDKAMLAALELFDEWCA